MNKQEKGLLEPIPLGGRMEANNSSAYWKDAQQTHQPVIRRFDKAEHPMAPFFE